MTSSAPFIDSVFAREDLPSDFGLATQKGIERCGSDMLQNSHSEDKSSKRPRVLLITGKPSLGDIITPFLVAMGYVCSAAANWSTLETMLERETFDAVLLDLVHPPIPEEEAIVKIKGIDPALARRLVVIGGSVMEPKIAKLIEHHRLSYVSQDDLVPQLWTVLQRVVAQPDLLRLTSRYLKPARMIFDSFKSPSPGGVRSFRTSVRQFVYQHESTTIDILMETEQGSGRLLLTGQILSARPDNTADLPVLLISGTRTLARTITDRFGEFTLEFEPTVDAGLEIRLVERLWVSIPLGNLERKEGFADLNAAG
jgi:CheY-like chemotaxis protein